MERVSTLNQVAQYLTSYGWKHQITEDGRILAAFQGDESATEFNLFVTVSEHWVGFTVWPYLFAIRDQHLPAIARKLSLLNFYELKMARFAMTDKGEATICMDLPIAGLNETLVHTALEIIGYYADKYYLVLISLQAGE